METTNNVLLRLPSGRTRVLHDASDTSVLLSALADLEGLPPAAVRLVLGGAPLHPCAPLPRDAFVAVDVRLGLAGGGGDGDQVCARDEACGTAFFFLAARHRTDMLEMLCVAPTAA